MKKITTIIVIAVGTFLVNLDAVLIQNLQSDFMGHAPADRGGMFTAVASSGTTIASALGVSIFGNFLKLGGGASHPAFLSRALQIDAGFHHAVFLAAAFDLAALVASMISNPGQRSLPGKEENNE